MTDTPLKPCPFCGGEAETDETIITDEFDEPTDAKECVVCCPECRIWFIGSTPAEAIAAWNSRPTPTSADNARVAMEPVAWIRPKAIVEAARNGGASAYLQNEPDEFCSLAIYTQDQLDAAVRAERERLLSHIDGLIETLQEGLMTDAGLSKLDRQKMRAQIDALDVAAAAIRGGE